MTDTARPSGSRSQYGLAGIPRWSLPLLPVILVGGIAMARTQTSVTAGFGPRTGVPDSLRELRVPTVAPVSVPTPYLDRVIKPTVDPRERAIDDMAQRYHLTETMARMVHDAAAEVGLDPELGFRLIRVESVFDVDAVGQGGAAGLVQMMPGTARDINPEIDTTRELMDPHTNMRLGFGYLREMIQRYDKYGADAVRLGVIAYNRGEISVDRALKRGKDPENGYGQRVLGPRAHGGRSYAGKGVIPLPDSAAAKPAAAQ